MPPIISDFEFEEDCIQIEFSKGTFNKGTEGPISNIMFDEVTNTQALGNLTLSNRAGKTQVTRFKLDSGAGANLLPVGAYYRSGTVNSKSFVGKVLLQIKWKFELTYAL